MLLNRSACDKVSPFSLRPSPFALSIPSRIYNPLRIELYLGARFTREGLEGDEVFCFRATIEVGTVSHLCSYSLLHTNILYTGNWASLTLLSTPNPPIRVMKYTK